jgi:hypothetical protein
VAWRLVWSEALLVVVDVDKGPKESERTAPVLESPLKHGLRACITSSNVMSQKKIKCEL